ncbi:phosphocarrier protein HPr [Halorhodospira abdelmalekii]|uniref:HPr family phosphocarrier protein n=1 Tax=Halorhodospira abdelmalekii TaxID=421629 RepID=UPI001906107B|nr:HPr family phosphocarrier protein [Halorhodospira abdelmalekii]MBK1734078.1 phosphocarrier protein HPr [Halorhodospira abdelmalekii]
MTQQETVICNRLGLHARAAARFVAIASEYRSEIHVSSGDRRVNGKSIMGLMMLAAGVGTRLTIEADGADEQEALTALCQLVEEGFGEAH